MRIRQCAFERSREIIRRSGIVAELEAQLRPPGVGGKPRQLDVETLLAAAIHAFDMKTATLANVHAVLTSELAASYQYRLGVRTRIGLTERVITRKQVYYLFGRIAELLDYAPLATKKERTKNKSARNEALTEDDRLEREARFLELINRLVRASRPTDVPPAETLAIDATSLPTWGLPKGPSKEAAPDKSANERVRSTDGEARWGKQTRTHQNGSKHYFGLTVVSSASIHGKGSDAGTLKLIEDLTIAPSTANVATAALAIIDDRTKHIGAPGEVAADRGFTYIPEFSAGLHERRIEGTIDIHPNDSGSRPDPATGVLMIDGWPHVPWTPKRLHRIPRPPRFTIAKLDVDATKEEEREHAANRRALTLFKERIAERGKYALSPNGRAKADGRRHFFTNRHDVHLATAAHRAALVFKQTTITIGADVAPKLRQHLRWGSPEWIEAYSPRSAVEGTYGNLKSPDGEGLRRGWIRLVGLVRTGLMVAFAAIHHNLRVARRWAERIGATTTDPLLAADPPDYGFEERTVDDLVAAAQAPPLAI